MFVHIFIHAKNVLQEQASTGEQSVGGFYVSRTVEAETLQDAQDRVINLLREDPGFAEHVKNPEDNPPTFEFEKIEVVEEQDQVNSGIVFYIETDDPETKYYVWNPGILKRASLWWRKLRGHLTLFCS